MLKALLIQRIFSIPTDTLLIVFLKYSQELRDFCGFDVVPDGSKFTRFKQDFLSDLQSMFDHLVDLTEPICQNLDSALASMTIFDISGIEAWVTENNPKYANRIIKQLKAFKKSHNLDDSYDPYKAAYGSMPTHAASNQAIQQMYINGHFCYAYKFGIITNGLIAIARIKAPAELQDALNYPCDFSSRCRTPQIGDIIIWKNVQGNYAGTKIISIKDDTRGADHDELTCEYIICN